MSQGGLGHLSAEMETLRSADAAGRATDETRAPKGAKPAEGGISHFWQVFGGAIFSIVALIAINLFNNLSVGISELRAELARVNEAKGEFAKKDEVNAIRVLATTHAGYRAEIDSLKERATKYRAELEDAKKSHAAALDALKKDAAGLDAVKERLLAVSADLKSAKDDLIKVRTDADKNQAADNERRDQRTLQMKQLEDLVKETAKAVQETREKLARLEGQTGPPTPPKTPIRPKTANLPGGDKD